MKEERYLFELGIIMYSVSLGCFLGMLSLGVSSYLFWSIVLMGAGIAAMLRAIIDTVIKLNLIMNEIFKLIHTYANKDEQ